MRDTAARWKITTVSHRSDLLADVIISIAYREDLYDVDAIINDVRATHGLATVADLEPGTYQAVLDAHRR